MDGGNPPDERSLPGAPRPDPQVFLCGPVAVAHVTPHDAVDQLIEWALQNRTGGRCGRSVHLVNAWSVVLADEDPALRDALASPATCFPDGTPLVWNARVRRRPVPPERVRGPQFFLDVLDRGRRHELRHYFLGSTPETLESLVRSATERYPGLRVAGSYSPPFRKMTPEELAAQDQRLVSAGADVVWVGLGTPKQDFETRRIADELGFVAAAVGAAFDFTAGNLTPAPAWMQRSGLEWVHRFASEPRRLWRRYLVGNAKFVLIASRGSSARAR